MAQLNSPLVTYTKLSPNHSGRRTHVIDTITPHCVVGQATVEAIGNCFISPSVQASCNYGIGHDGKIMMCVEESNRSWCTSSNANDQRAVTIECASDNTHPYAMKPAVYDSLVNLCVDICKRNGRNRLIWLGDKDTTLKYTPKSNEMIITVHRWFANKSCPGDWLYSRLDNLANDVTRRLNGKDVPPVESKPTTTNSNIYRVRKSWDDAKSQIGAYKVLESAKKQADDNLGYNVYDKDGVMVYSTVPNKPVTKRAAEVANKYTKSISGTYKVNTKNGLHIRDGAGASKKSLGILPNNTTVRNYGYYNISGSIKWLYVTAIVDNVIYTGYCSSQYLTKK
jgi:hypothetical protein